MTQLNQIYKCDLCGNIVEVIHPNGGQLVCCGRPMTLQRENTVEASKEKHIPIIEKAESGVSIKVGSIEHPMEEKHYIEWIEVQTPKNIYRKCLKPGEKPEAVFKMNDNIVCVRAYCNIHGLWEAN
ncbi:desulfoferrodoxin [Clostridium ljungdahlii]|uniref:Desulfoferrodoxin n=1 Tax=Clostridium ljungdahlii TaxID=1538 RepID=A0A168R8U1_9CLOT|nr:desulfoferrodoxin [Clostridium ljungdahlii]OAA90353.1 Desulfoferrodoxin [Clostridium ljungdahlii]